MKQKLLYTTIFMIINGALQSQNFSGLENKRLQKVSNVSKALASGLGTLLGGKVNGNVDSVLVLYDGERELKIQIFFQGYEKADLLIKADDIQNINQTTGLNTRLKLSGKTSPIECTLSLDPAISTEQYLKTPYLEIQAVKPGGRMGKIVSYELGKNWNLETDDASIVINVKPEPIGSAREINERRTNASYPARTIIFTENKPFLATKTSGKASSIGTINSPKISKEGSKASSTLRVYALSLPSKTTSSPADLISIGPDNNPINLWTTISSDIDFQSPQELSNISMTIFPDKHPASNVYYYLPSDYHLKYDANIGSAKGYDFSVLYGSRNTTKDSGEAPVRMAAKLTPGISLKELNFIYALLKANIPSAKELRMMPLRETPTLSFSNYLNSQYNIPQNNIAVSAGSDFSGDIRVGWQTDMNTKEFIETALLSREGINAALILKPQFEDIVDQQIPVVINFADAKSFGKIVLNPLTWRTEKWRNGTPFPLQLQHLNIMVIDSVKHTPKIFSWSLKNALIPSRGQASFDATLVPLWWDRKQSAFMWIDYSVMDCEPCTNKILTAITGGISSSSTQTVRFTIPPAVFDTLKVSYFLITLRSKQLDPNGRAEKQLPEALKITKESDKAFLAGPLFIPSGAKAAFQYKITMATTDGDFIDSLQWISAAETDIYISKSKLKDLFPSNQ